VVLRTRPVILFQRRDSSPVIDGYELNDLAFWMDSRSDEEIQTRVEQTRSK